MSNTAITWNPSLSIGHEAIDRQHEELFHAFDKLRLAGQTPGKEMAALNCISELRQYIDAHFAAEEDYMRSISYAGLEEQQTAHALFKAQVADYVSSCESGYVPYADLAEFLSRWLGEHISTMDRKITA